MKNKLLVLGGGGHGRVVADAAVEIGYLQVAFLDDSPAAPSRVAPLMVAGRMSDIESLAASWGTAIAAVGDNAFRLDLLQRLRDAGFATPPIIHPRAAVSRRAHIEAGAFIAANVAVNVGASIGPGAILNTGATIDHDCIVGAGAHVSPGANLAGDVDLGARSWIGVGACVKNGVKIGVDVVVGAGSVVIRDVPDGQTVMGVPARAR